MRSRPKDGVLFPRGVQFVVTEEMHAWLMREAGEREISVSELLRQCVKLAMNCMKHTAATC